MHQGVSYLISDSNSLSELRCHVCDEVVVAVYHV